MRHLHAPESNHFNIKLLEAEHVLDFFKIEHDIKDLLPLKSEYIRMVWSIGWYGASGRKYMRSCTNYETSA
jgi:hypothetical protein